MSNAAEQQYAEQGIVYLDPKMRIKNYWTQRSHSFAELRVRELNSVMADRWLREIAKHIPAGDSFGFWISEPEPDFSHFCSAVWDIVLPGSI